MDIMVIGSGGREHALIKKLRESGHTDRIYALPGNGGISADAQCVDISAKDVDGVVSFAVEHSIGLAVIAPDDPLVMGMVDALETAGVPCFGPDKKAAVIEGSKVFSKNLMKKYNIPTADYQVFDDPKAALEYLKTAPVPTVVKADGLALGKGVIIAQTREEALDAVHSIMEDRVFGESGSQIVVEEFLQGPEVSVLSFTDGKTVVPMTSSMDHKRAGDGDTGLNTGGMGTIAPNPYYTDELASRCMREIFIPTMEAMNAEGRTFRGCLYFGLMLTDKGPKVIEYNCRFGDPEAQVVLPLLKSDLVDIMFATRNGTLDSAQVEFSDGAACCIIMASGGYPVKYDKGFKITLPDAVPENVSIYVAGARSLDGELLTNGGRVLGVTATANDLGSAVSEAYKAVETVHFDGCFYRSDIGAKALKALN